MILFFLLALSPLIVPLAILSGVLAVLAGLSRCVFGVPS